MDRRQIISTYESDRSQHNFGYWGLGHCMERTKKSSILGDEPDLFKGAQGRIGLYTSNGFAHKAYTAASANKPSPIIASISSTKINLDATLNDCERGYVPTVGRWGAEWPS